MIRNKKGFTLVELLAVIVILALILVIAVPQIIKTIDSAREGALVSSAKLIATSAEKEYLARKTLGDTSFEGLDTIPCTDVVKENTRDYEKCTIKFDENGKATVTLKGAGKFAGKYVCNANKTTATVSEESCTAVQLTINLNGGTVTENKQGKYEPDTEVELVTPTRDEEEYEKYIFNKWEIVSGEGATIEGNTLTMGTTATTIKATYITENAIELTIDLDGGSVTVDKQGKYEPGTIMALVSPTKENLGFKEWTIVGESDATIEGNILTLGTQAVEIKANYVTPTMVGTYEEINAAKGNGSYLMLSNDINTSSYFNGFNGILDGNNKTYSSTSSYTVIGTLSGSIKNIRLINSSRDAIRYLYTGEPNSIIDNVFIDAAGFNLHIDGGNYPAFVTNSTITGRNAVAEGIPYAKFVNVNFVKGNSNIYNYINLYTDIMFIDCNFDEEFEVGIADTNNEVIFINCKYNGELITEENVATIFDFDEDVMTGVEVRNTTD